LIKNKDGANSGHRFELLVIVDVLKLFLSLLLLSWAPNVTIWFFMVFADGTAIFFFKKIKEQISIERKVRKLKE
jgi:hypothetical protein